MTRHIRGTNGTPVHEMLVEEREDRHRQRTPLKVKLVEMERAFTGKMRPRSGLTREKEDEQKPRYSNLNIRNLLGEDISLNLPWLLVVVFF